MARDLNGRAILVFLAVTEEADLSGFEAQIVPPAFC